MAIEDNIRLMESQLTTWQAEIDQLRRDLYTEAEQARQRVMTEGQRRIDDLQKQKDETLNKLEELRKVEADKIKV